MNTAIKADSYTGLVHATRTLLQLFSQANQNGKLSACTIIDSPQYEKPILMIDMARKFFTVDELKNFIRIMAWVKMNEVHYILVIIPGEVTIYTAWKAKNIPNSQQKMAIIAGKIL